MAHGKVLVLAPHTDDAEIGCGGTIARLIEEGSQVYVAAFSTAEVSLPPGSAPTLLRDEFLQSMRTLGISAEHVSIYGYETRRFSYQRQELLEDLIQLRRRLEPDTVFLPASSDMHQDHAVVQAEGLRAFKDVTVWGFELPWNQVSFAAQGFVCLEERHVEAKWNAMCCYRSQFELARPYFARDAVVSLARVRGLQVKELYAEAFEVLRHKW